MAVKISLSKRKPRESPAGPPAREEPTRWPRLLIPWTSVRPAPGASSVVKLGASGPAFEGVVIRVARSNANRIALTVLMGVVSPVLLLQARGSDKLRSLCAGREGSH